MEAKPAFPTSPDDVLPVPSVLPSDGIIAAAPSIPTFRFLTYADVMNEPPKSWIVKGLLGRNDSALAYGHGKGGKTLVIFDLIGALIQGNCLFADLFSIEDPVNVVYATGEGQSGLPNRLRALNHKWNHDEEAQARLQILKQIPQLYQHDSPLSIRTFADDYAREFGTRLNGGLLILDTLARAAVGADENTAKDTTEILDAMAYARERLGCTVLSIHHANKAGGTVGQDIRGSSNLLAGFDTAIYVRRDPDGSRYLGSDTAKDSGDVADVLFNIVVHEWIDASGESHKGGYIDWIGVRPQRSDEVAAAETSVVDLLRRVARCETQSLTATQIAKRLEVPVTAKTITKHLQKLRLSPQSLVTGIEKPTVDLHGKPNREAWHYWWDADGEGAHLD